MVVCILIAAMRCGFQAGQYGVSFAERVSLKVDIQLRLGKQSVSVVETQSQLNRTTSGAFMRHLLVLFICAALVISASPVTAADGSSIRGTVVDPSGRAIVAARVVLHSPAGADRVTMTDRTGRFVFDEAPAQASLHVAADRFSEATVNVREQRSDLRIVLEAAAVTDEITVTAPPPLPIRSSTATKTDTPLRDVPQSVSVITRDARRK